MLWKIDKRYIGDAVVLELVGRITLGDSVLRDRVGELSSGSEPIVILDLSGISYIDSAGIGALVSSFTLLRNIKKELLICHPLLNVTDLLQVTQLASVFQVFPSVEQALSNDRSSIRLFFCPVAGCDTWTPTSSGTRQVCMHCASEIDAAPDDTTGGNERREWSRLRIPSYVGEYVAIVKGTPCVLQIPRRFDLFANNALEKALNTIGWNKSYNTHQVAAIVDLSELQELSDPGAAALLQIDQPVTDGNAAVFFARPRSPEILQRISNSVALHTSYAEAIVTVKNALRSRSDKKDGNLYGFGFRTGFLE
jgi:anti-sigma B factor antagonist